MSKTLFVSGATGTTGNATLRSLLARGANVIAGVHSPGRATALAELGVAIRPFDLADVSGMTAAMRGTDGFYLVTPPSEQTRAMTKAMVSAAKAAGVRHVVKLSGLNVDKLPDLELARWHAAAEEEIMRSGLGFTFLRPNSFIQNLVGAAQTVKAHHVYYNTYGSAAVSFVDVRDIGDVAAAVLLSEEHIGKIFNLTGPRSIAKQEVVELLSAAAGKPVGSIDIGGDPLVQALMGMGMPQAVAAASAQLLDYMATGAACEISPDVQNLLGRPPRDIRHWVAENANLFR